FSSRRRHTRFSRDWSSDVCSSDLGHSKHDFLEAQLPAALDDLLQRGDQRLAAIKAKALGALVLDVDELLEAFGLDQLLQDRLLRSEERRVGKECKFVGWLCDEVRD